MIGADFRTRAMSAVVLAAVAIGLTSLGRMGFGLLVLLVSGILAWEWGGIVRGKGHDSLFAVHAMVVAAAVLLAFMGWAGAGAGLVLVGAVLVGVLAGGETATMSALGVPYTGLPAISLVWLHADPAWGLAAILFLLLVVWSTDTCAYLAGRSLGGPKLWPQVSPNKTWSGFLGGVLSAATLAGLASFWIAGASAIRLFAIGLLLAVVSQGGDLAESAMKRHYGVKDASSLIPGHGGFMDRVDGLVAAAAAAALIAALAGGRWPARALLGLS